jgi:hypothetical protein
LTKFSQHPCDDKSDLRRKHGLRILWLLVAIAFRVPVSRLSIDFIHFRSCCCCWLAVHVVRSHCSPPRYAQLGGFSPVRTALVPPSLHAAVSCRVLCAVLRYAHAHAMHRCPRRDAFSTWENNNTVMRTIARITINININISSSYSNRERATTTRHRIYDCLPS